MMNEEMIQKAAQAMVPILERESNMVWGERTCATILRRTLEQSGLHLEADGAEQDPALADYNWIRQQNGLPPLREE
jgi:hypothetical protein